MSHKNRRKIQGPRSPNYTDAKAYAIRLLSYRSRSRKEILEKLKEKDFDTEESKKVINFLEDSGFIKDESLAESLLRNGVERKYLGKKGIKMLLARRGIERELIDKSISALTENMEYESAMRFVEKKLRTSKNYSAREDRVTRQKLWRMLARRGFSADVINSVIKTIYPPL